MSRFVVIDRTGEIITDFSFGSGSDTVLRLWDDIIGDYDILSIDDYEEVVINGVNFFKPKVHQYSLPGFTNDPLEIPDFFKPYENKRCQHKNTKKVDMIYTTINVCMDCKEEVK